MKNMFCIAFCTLVLIGALTSSSCSKSRTIVEQNSTTKLTIFTGIAPLKYLVQEIAGEKAEVFIMVPSGSSPATWEPLPSQLLKLSRAQLYFSIEVPFEKQWLPILKKNNPETRFISLQKGINQRETETLSHSHDNHNHNSHDDPHSWLNPLNAIIMANTITDSLSKLDPRNTQYYHNRQKQLATELRQLDRETEQALALCKSKSIMVFHPSYGYFCDRYHLSQIPIEIQGRKPAPGELAHIISLAKKQQIHTLLVQQQFSQTEAKTVAKAINGTVVSVNPLSDNYPKMITSIREAIQSECQK